MESYKSEYSPLVTDWEYQVGQQGLTGAPKLVKSLPQLTGIASKGHYSVVQLLRAACND